MSLTTYSHRDFSHIFSLLDHEAARRKKAHAQYISTCNLFARARNVSERNFKKTISMVTIHMMDQNNEGEDPDRVDYLQDPALWEDHLPQPYRMIEHIINQMLDDTWECIVQNEIYVLGEATRVKIPEGTNGRVVCEDVLTQSLGDVCGGKEVVFIANMANVFAIDAKSRVVSKQDLQQEVKSLVVVEREGLHVLIIQHDTGT